jgi:hypothetical protein
MPATQVLTFPQPGATVSEILAVPAATCPLCHTSDATLTEREVAQGAGWRCGTCHQLWNAPRLETVAAYARWDAQRQLAKAGASSRRD